MGWPQKLLPFDKAANNSLFSITLMYLDSESIFINLDFVTSASQVW